MIFLSKSRVKHWKQLSETIIRNHEKPSTYRSRIQSNQFGMFCFFAGTNLLAKGQIKYGMDWLKEGTFCEADGLFSNAYMTGFLNRHNQHFEAPCLCFEDPRPFIHFTTTPCLKNARQRFITTCAHTLPDFNHPISFMDIGVGNGTLTVDVLKHLLETGKAPDIKELLLIDASPAMLELAETTTKKAFPAIPISTINDHIENVAANLDHTFDVAMSSLAYHHMPYETKVTHTRELAKHIDHFLLFELDANNDTPELFSPELACAVYQSYGRIIDFIFSHDAPIEVANSAVDNFLMVEQLSFLTQSRGMRTDYHMLRQQWHTLFHEALGQDFCCLSDTTCYADEHLDLFALHYGKC